MIRNIKNFSFNKDTRNFYETIKKKNCGFWGTVLSHSSEIRGFHSIKFSSEMLQNMYMKNHVGIFFFVSHFIQLYLLHYECWHRSGVTFIREKMHEMRNEKKLGGFFNK